MDPGKLNSICEILENTSINEFILETKTSKIRIELETNRKTPTTLNTNDLSSITKSEKVNTAVFKEKTDNDTDIDIVSRHVGFFSRYDPKLKRQYIKLRDTIAKGDVIGVIRSIHINYEVISEVNGKVIDFLVEEGQPVEYCQPLIRLSAQ